MVYNVVFWQDNKDFDNKNNREIERERLGSMITVIDEESDIIFVIVSTLN